MNHIELSSLLDSILGRGTADIEFGVLEGVADKFNGTEIQFDDNIDIMSVARLTIDPTSMYWIPSRSSNSVAMRTRST